MPQFLVSLTNHHEDPASSLFLLKTDGRAFECKRVDGLERLDGARGYTGIVGLCRSDEHYYAAVQGKYPRILVFERSFSLKKVIELERAKDLHSIRFHDDRLYVVSTGTNQVISIEPHQDRVSEEVVWSYDESRVDEDLVHLNSLEIVDGEILVGHCGENSSGSLRVGEILNLSTGQTLLRGLREPHSLKAHKGALYVAESLTGNVIEIGRKGQTCVVARAKGYVRGLEVCDFALLFGESAFRTVSRKEKEKKEVVLVNYGQERLWEISRINFLFRDHVASVDTVGLGSEIYDILCIEA